MEYGLIECLVSLAILCYALRQIVRARSIKARYLLAILFILFILSTAATAKPPKYINGTVDRVVDGDTIVVRDGEKLHKIRLYGIDTPEKELKGRWKAQPYAFEATAFAVEFTFEYEVTVLTRGSGAYQRILGEVFVDGRSLNRELVRAGLAWFTVRYTKRDQDIGRLEAAARKAKRGLWADDNPVSPYDHRHQKR